jgi:hypothetical protein
MRLIHYFASDTRGQFHTSVIAFLFFFLCDLCESLRPLRLKALELQKRTQKSDNRSSRCLSIRAGDLTIAISNAPDPSSQP